MLEVYGRSDGENIFVIVVKTRDTAPSHGLFCDAARRRRTPCQIWNEIACKKPMRADSRGTAVAPTSAIGNGGPSARIIPPTGHHEISSRMTLLAPIPI